MIRVGVIGVGSMGKHHARVYSQIKGVELVGVADLNKEGRDAIAKQCHTTAFADYKELIKQDLDALSITVPTLLHEKIAVEAAEDGKDILVEKPLADTVKNAKKIIEVCKKNEVKLMVGHIERFNPIVPAIKQSIKDEAIASIDITRVGPFPPRIKEVGVITDLAVHDIDLIRYLTGSEFKTVYGLSSKNISKCEDTAILSFEMENGALAHITTNWLTPFKIREINISTKNKFVEGLFIEQKVKEYSNYTEDNTYLVKELPVPYGEPLVLELTAFVESIKHNREPAITGQDGLKALEIAQKCLTCLCR